MIFMNIPSLYEQFQKQWGRFQTGWLISDTHFGDEDLRAGMPNRPSDEEIVKSINSCVGKNDLLIHLGDVGDIEYVRKLKGYKVLIMGNHDLGASNYKRQKITRNIPVDEMTLLEVRELASRDYPNWKIHIERYGSYWIITADNGLFDEVYEGALIVGEKLILTHEPIVGLTWAMNLHGHVHDKRAKTDAYHTNCCSDVIGYEPINLTQKLKQGITARIASIHRQTIDKATERKARRSTHSTNMVKNR